MAETLASWVKRISDQEIPIFKYTVNAITDVVANEDTSTAELAQIILRDASLTARILRVANSTIYNPTSSPISTVSRAVVFIGFNLVRDLSLSLAVIDALLGENVREHTLKLMAQSFHAAVQAKSLAEKRGDDRPEEVFIAALLHHLGEMAFWCIATEEGDKILSLQEKGCSAEMAQREALGFSFNQLTVGLTQDWHLSDLLHSVINQPELNNPRIRDIVYSHELAFEAGKDWNSNNAKRVIQKLAQHLKEDNKTTTHYVMETAKQAAEVAQLFGASAIIKYLPIPKEKQTIAQQDELLQSEFPETDPKLQLNILRDLTGMLESKPNLNLILEVVMEGIYRGVGMDRTIFAILSPEKNQLAGKYALGKNNRQLVEKFNFKLADNPLLTALFKSQQASWVKDSQSNDYSGQISTNMRITLASPSFFICPILIGQKPIGIIYADRQASERPLDQETFESFRHFCIQANMVINQVTQANR